jgi:anti-sigma B factor antagonist
MKITSRFAGSATILDLDGRFDMTSAAAVAQALERASTGTPAQVVLNLAGVSFIDSTALATMVQGLKRCRQRQGDLYLCGVQPQVYMIFELTRLDSSFHMFVDDRQAVQAFANEIDS